METEIWKDIKWYEWLYKVSSFGNVKSLNYWRSLKEKILCPWNSIWYLYLHIQLCNRFTRKNFSIHRLVALTFLENTENKPCVNHINWIKTDNRIENLEWCTRSENTIHSYRILWNKHWFRLKNISRWKFWKESVRSRIVLQFTKNLEFIKKWDSIVDVEIELWIHHWNISACCNWKRENAWGFIWKYNF